VTTTETIRTCVENAEWQVRMFSQRVQWTPLLLVISIFACENTHRVALGLQYFSKAVENCECQLIDISI